MAFILQSALDLAPRAFAEQHAMVSSVFLSFFGSLHFSTSADI
jgi:hypothetical protein